jgi:uncharacterized surface protein with fasciclin (FAS1) repeats
LSIYLDQNLTALNGSTLKIIQEQQAYYLEDVKGNRALIGPNPLRMDNGDIYYLDEVLY